MFQTLRFFVLMMLLMMRQVSFVTEAAHYEIPSGSRPQPATDNVVRDSGTN